MVETKSSALPLAMWASQRAVQTLLPLCCANAAVDLVADGATAIVTNNRGPEDWLYFDGRRCSYWVSWAPQRANIGVCLTLFTYAGTMRCSVISDTSCAPEPERLVALFSEEFRELASLAGVRAGRNREAEGGAPEVGAAVCAASGSESCSNSSTTVELGPRLAVTRPSATPTVQQTFEGAKTPSSESSDSLDAPEQQQAGEAQALCSAAAATSQGRASPNARKTDSRPGAREECARLVG